MARYRVIKNHNVDGATNQMIKGDVHVVDPGFTPGDHCSGCNHKCSKDCLGMIASQCCAKELLEQEVIVPVHVLDRYVDMICTSEIKDHVKLVLEKSPDYFWHIPASSTAKYHPRPARERFGLAGYHTPAAVQIALELFNNDTVQRFSQIERDIIIGALLCHDVVKNGVEYSKYTDAGHGMLLEKLMGIDPDDYQEDGEPTPLCIMYACIRSHMGQWNTDFRDKSKVVAPKPVDRIERFVHMCDYLASRKCIEINFDEVS